MVKASVSYFVRPGTVGKVSLPTLLADDEISMLKRLERSTSMMATLTTRANQRVEQRVACSVEHITRLQYCRKRSHNEKQIIMREKYEMIGLIDYL